MSKLGVIGALFAAAAAFLAVIVAFYVFIVPYFAPAYKTYTVLLIGVGAAAMAGCCIILRFAATLPPLRRGLLSFAGGIGIGALVLLFSLLVILNTRGV